MLHPWKSTFLDQLLGAGDGQQGQPLWTPAAPPAHLHLLPRWVVRRGQPEADTVLQVLSRDCLPAAGAGPPRSVPRLLALVPPGLRWLTPCTSLCVPDQTYCDRLVQDTPFLTGQGCLSEQQVDRIVLQLNRYYPQVLTNKEAEKVLRR